MSDLTSLDFLSGKLASSLERLELAFLSNLVNISGLAGVQYFEDVKLESLHALSTSSPATFASLIAITHNLTLSDLPHLSDALIQPLLQRLGPAIVTLHIDRVDMLLSIVCPSVVQVRYAVRARVVWSWLAPDTHLTHLALLFLFLFVCLSFCLSHRFFWNSTRLSRVCTFQRSWN